MLGTYPATAVSFPAVAHWLMKTEPEAFSIDDLERQGIAHWDGVRAYQARNNLRAMKVGEQAFFYHSSCDPPGIVGICEVVREAYPDHTAWDPESKYFDPRSTPEKPEWFMPDVKLVEKFPRMITLAELREMPALDGMFLLRKGARLSVQPVTDGEWDIIVAIAHGGDQETSTLPFIP
jgi:predicted RNA-binding protein with PUA-like domain